jgi:hypothetical protein
MLHAMEKRIKTIGSDCRQTSNLKSAETDFKTVKIEVGQKHTHRSEIQKVLNFYPIFVADHSKSPSLKVVVNESIISFLAVKAIDFNGKGSRKITSPLQRPSIPLSGVATKRHRLDLNWFSRIAGRAPENRQSLNLLLRDPKGY